MPVAAPTVTSYLASLPAERKRAITAVRTLIKKHLPKGYKEAFAYGMIAYSVPLSIYPHTYNKQPLMYIALASKKNYMALHLCHAYGMPALRKNLETRFKKAGKKLDMGKGCLRFKQLDDLELPAVAEVIAAVPMKDYVAFAKAVYAR